MSSLDLAKRYRAWLEGDSDDDVPELLGALVAEHGLLLDALRRSVAALRNGSGISDKASTKFHLKAPEEIEAHCRELERQRDEARAELAEAREHHQDCLERVLETAGVPYMRGHDTFADDAIPAVASLRAQVDRSVASNPTIQSGELVFAGTRITVAAIFSFLASCSEEETHRNYPDLPRATIAAALRLYQKSIVAHVVRVLDQIASDLDTTRREPVPVTELVDGLTNAAQALRDHFDA